MSLITNVKLSSVNNLSDARYGAGMGVRYIGFPINQQSAQAGIISKLSVIAGWLSGVQIIFEFGEFDEELYQMAAAQIEPYAIQIEGIDNLSKLFAIKKPVFAKFNYHTKFNYVQLLVSEPRIDTILLIADYDSLRTPEIEQIKHWCFHRNIMLGGDINSSNVKNLIEAFNPYGISLEGGNEEKPGFKNFDALSEVLELLEEE